MPEPTTEGEKTFKLYLDKNGYAGRYQFEQPVASKRKVIDYTLGLTGGPCYLDVKDLDPAELPSDFGAYDPYPALRKKIEEGREKFSEYKGHPCGLVLYNRGNQLVSLAEHWNVLGAMYGDYGFSFPIGSDGAAAPAQETFLGRGKMIRPHWKKAANTTISAIITLHHVNIGMRRFEKYLDARPEYKADPEKILGLTSEKVGFDMEEKHLGVIVWENLFAAVRFPVELFKGPYDQRWSAEPERQFVSFRGSGLL